MQIHGESQIYFQGMRVGQIRADDLSGFGGLFPRLFFRFVVNMSLPEKAIMTGKLAPDALSLYDFRGELRWQQGGLVIGRLFEPAESQVIRSQLGHDGSQLLLFCDLDWSRLQRIESLRDSKGPVFQTEFYARMTLGNDSLSTRLATVQVHVPMESWHAVLGGFGAHRFDILEIALPLSSTTDTESIAGHLRSARSAIDNGSSQMSLVETRKALEAAIQFLRSSVTAPGVGEALKPRFGDDKSDAITGILSRVKDLASRAAHPGSASETSALEARFVLHQAQGLVAFLTAVATQARYGTV